MKRFAITGLTALLLSAASLTDTTQQIFERASQALKAGDYPAAEAGFRRVLEAEPRNVSAMGNLGVVYSRTLRFAKAIAIYKRTLSLSPQEQGILLNLGLVYLKQDDYERARPYFQRLRKLDPKNRQAA